MPSVFPLRLPRIGIPQSEARKEILQIHANKVRMADEVDLRVVADMTVGFSGAQLENLINEAALLTARKAKNQVKF
jgi:cell division protease FtsH